MKKHRRNFFSALVVLASLSLAAAQAQVAPQPEVLIVDASSASHPLPHFWEQMFGSGRAILSLRESYRRDLRDVKQITGFQFIRFHDILDDDIGVYQEDSQGHPVYNFSYVDQIYDGLLANGVKPYVELSFMPDQLAAKPATNGFWYKPDLSPPKDYAKWGDLVAAFVKHLIDRYGMDEVASWYFEVWNEPNIDFWTGNPKQDTYWQLYDSAARAIKGVSPRLRVGGPSTAQAAWVDAFLQHCAENHVPVDFVSTHVYSNDRSQDVFGTNESIPLDKMDCRAAKKVHDQVKASPMPNLPIIWSEFGAGWRTDPNIQDSVYMGPWLADTIRQCDGLADIMSYWSFSDVFDEMGVIKKPFFGDYGLIATGGIPKPSYLAFELMHKLGDQRLALASDSALLTRKKDGTLVLALWNYTLPGETGPSKTFTLHFKNGKASRARIWRLDAQHGNVITEYKKLGEPPYPTQAQIKELRAASTLAPAENLKLHDGALSLSVPAQGLVLLELPQ